MRSLLAISTTLILATATAASAQTLTFEDLPSGTSSDSQYTLTTGGFSFKAAPLVATHRSGAVSNSTYGYLEIYDPSATYNIVRPSKLIYSFTSDITLTKTNHDRFSFEGAQLGTWRDFWNDGLYVEGIRNGTVVDHAVVSLSGFQATNFTAAWTDLDSVIIKPTVGFRDYYDYNEHDIMYAGANGQPANYIWLANVQVNSATPEASTWILMGLGCIGMMAFARRRQLAFDI